MRFRGLALVFLLLSSALQMAHGFAPRIIAAAERLTGESRRRGWVGPA